MEIFSTRELIRPGLLGRLLNKPVKENAPVAIENLLASRDPKDIRASDINAILSSHGLTETACTEVFADLYRKAVAAFAQDIHFSESENAALAELRRVLKINEESKQQIHLSVVIPIFEDLLGRMIGGLQLTEETKKGLTRVTDNLELPENVVHEVYQRKAIEVFSQHFLAATSDNRLSPEEERRLTALLDQFGPKSRLDESTQQQWNYFKLLYEISQGAFSDQGVSIRLQRGERCALQLYANHYEMRTVTRRIRYAGPTASIRIMKGVRFRLGDLAVSSVTEDVMKHLDSGILYITTKRLIFDGERKSTSINLSRILDFSCYNNALVIEKDTGKDQIFRFAAQDGRLIEATMEGVLNLFHNESK